jgi:hypothetical protein
MKALTILVLTLALGACANREIQSEGAGTDQMLKSPCACVLLPYTGPSYPWGRG